MRLVLIRHAASDHRPGADDGLTQIGVGQARDLASRFRTSCEVADCDTFLCSPLPRARQTADLLLSELPVDNLIEDPELCEMNDFVGNSGGSSRTESFSSFRARVEATLQRLAREHVEDTVVAVTHAGFILTSLIALFNIPRPGTGARLDPDHASLTEWRKLEGIWRLVQYNVRGPESFAGRG